MNSRERAEKILAPFHCHTYGNGTTEYADGHLEAIAAELDAHAEEAIEEIKQERESIGYTKGYLESKNAIWNAAIEEAIKTLEAVPADTYIGHTTPMRFAVNTIRVLKKTEEK